MADIQTPELDAFLAAGNASQAAPTPIPMPQGGSATPELDQFIAPELQQTQFGTPGQQAIAGLEGLARGATLGGSDVAETKLLGIPAANIKGRAEANPWTSGVGQLGGAAGTIAATGGIAAPVEGALGGGLAARALGFGLEGGAFGAGQAASDAALGDHELTAQHVLADVGMGAALGGGLGVLSKGVEAALPAATRKLGNSLGSLRDVAIGSAEEPSPLVKGASIPGSVFSGKSPEDWTKAFYEGLNRPDSNVTMRGLVKNLQELHGAAKNAATELYETAAPTNIAKSLEKFPVEDAKAAGSSILNQIETVVTKLDEDGTPISTLSNSSNEKIISDRLLKLSQEINGAKTAEGIHSALDTFAKDTGKLIKFDKLPTAAQQGDQELLRGIRSAVRDNLSNEEIWGPAAQHYSQASEAYADYVTARKNFQSAFMKKEAGPSGMAKFVVDPAKVTSFFNRVGDPALDLKASYLNDFITQAENLAKASENYHGFVSSEKSLSKRVSELAKDHASLSSIAKSLQNKASGEGGHLTGDAVIGYGLHAMGVPHPAVGAALGTLEAYRAIKNPYQTGVTLANTAQKLRALGEITDRVTNKINGLAKNIFSSAPARAVSASSGTSFSPSFASNKDYESKTHRIAELMTNPNRMFDHLSASTEAMHEAAPNVAGAVQSGMVRGAQFLDSKIPVPKNQLPLSPKWVPSKAQIAQFSRYYHTVNDPVSVMKDIKLGTLTSDQMEALKAVHPELLQQMQQAVTENLDPKNAQNLPYATKMAIARFIGFPLDENMLPQSIAANQAVFTQMHIEEAQKNAAIKNGGIKPSQKGLSKITLAERTSLTPNREEN